MLSIRALLRISPLTFVVVLALAGATTAAASAPIAASGAITFPTCDFTSQQTVGTNTILTGTCYETLTGTFTGTSVAQATVTFHAEGTSEGNAVDTFTGTVDGRSGTVTFRDLAHGDPSGNVSGTLTIIGGTGGLANLHGSLKQSSTINSNVSYTGQIQFAGP